MIVFILVLVSTARRCGKSKSRRRSPRPGDNALFVTVVGRQWWWEYRYEQYDGRRLGFVTANELHMPASEEGKPRPVYLTLKSADVYHSFWVPRLAGKTDSDPGRNESHVVSDRPRPGCSSANAPNIAARSTPTCCCAWSSITPEEFERWLDQHRQAGGRRSGGEPTGKSGRFLASRASIAIASRGTSARGGYAPDLTHLMSRQTLALGHDAERSAEESAAIGSPIRSRSSPAA